MLDFNAKKEILRRLQKKGAENVFMRILCAIAALFVKIWYGIVCRISMAFSDKNGNLFGIKGLGKKAGERKRSRREDDVVYIRKPFFGRVLSAVLAFSFAFMVAPELGLEISVSAAGEYVPYGSSGYYYNTAEWDGKPLKINRVNEIAGNGSAKIFWEVISGTPDMYEIDYENRSNGVLEHASTNWRLTNYTFEGLSTETRYTFKVRAKKNVKLYTYLPADEDADPPRPTDQYPSANLTEPVYSDWIEFFLDENLNASMDLPVLQDIEYDATTNKATLKWTHVAQVGYEIDGTENARPAEGYVIFRAEVNSSDSSKNAFRQISAKRTSELRKEIGTDGAGSPVTYLYFDDNTVVQGMIYEYYVMAYRDVFGMSGGQYASSTPGMITSEGESGAVKKQLITKPTSPQNVKVTSDGKKTLTVTWQPGSGNIDGYYIYRSEGEEITQEMATAAGYDDFAEYIMATKVSGTDQLAELPSTAKSYSDSSSDLVNTKTYWYYVISYVNKSNTTKGGLYSLPESASGRIGATVNSPSGLKTVSGDGYIEVSWNSVANADGYYLHIMKIRNSDGTMIPEDERQTIVIDWKQNKYIHEDFDGFDLLNNEMYTYWVEAYINVRTSDDVSVPNRDKLVSSPPSSSKTATVGIVIGAPEDVFAVGRDGAIDVSWSKVDGATGYEIHYWKGNERETTIDRSGLNYNHINLKNGDVYYYYIVPYKVVNGVRVLGGRSKTVNAKVGVDLETPQDLKGTTTDGQITVSWKKVNGATGYTLYYKGPYGTWTPVDLSGTSFNHTMLQNGDRYEYKVVAYKIVTGEKVLSPESITISIVVGNVLDTPKDFTVTTTDGVANLKWTASKGAEGYIVHAYSPQHGSFDYDVSKPQFAHNNLINGDTWTYYVVAYKTVNGSRTYSKPTQSVTISVGVSMAAAVDLTATPGNRQVDLKWTAVAGAQGYVVYLYNNDTMEYDPIAVTSKPNYTHLGLKNGVGYTYMVAAFKNINGTRVYGEYSLPVTAIPTAGSLTDIDRNLTIKGTAPYGISHGEYISASANHAAFDESVDVYFTTNKDSTNVVKDVLKGYAKGLSSFIIYPFDISIYKENTFIKVSPNRGYSVTITMPIPDKLIAYRDYLTVVHINEEADDEYITDVEWLDYTDRRLEVLPCAVLDIDNVWCIQFECTNFSPFAIVVYKDHLSDVSAGGGIMDGIFAGNFNSGVLLFTTLPDILPNNKKLKIVSDGKKRYRIKSIEKKDM